MKRKQSKFKPLMCTALLVANLSNPTYFYANDGSVEEANSVEAVEEINASEASGEDLAKVKEHTIHAINIDEFGDSALKDKYINQINQAQTPDQVHAIFAEFNKQKQNAIREEFQKKIEDAVNRARRIPGFILVDNHEAYIQLIQNAASEDEIENHLRELKQKADEALAINAKQNALSKHIRDNYKYLGERLGDYNHFVESQQTDAELETLRQQAETEHKGIVLKLIDQTLQRLQAKLDEINALPELDASNSDYNNQRQAWDFARSEIPKALAFAKEVKKQDHAKIVDFYESGALYWEIYANIEHLARKADAYTKEFPNNAELAQKVRDLIYADGNPYASLDGAQEVPSDGVLRSFYKTDILKKYQEIEQLYNQLKADANSSESSSDMSSESQSESQAPQSESSSNMTSESQSAPQSESSSNMTSESQSAPQSESSSSMTSESQSVPQSESSSSMISESQSAPQSESSSSMTSESQSVPQSESSSSMISESQSAPQSESSSNMTSESQSVPQSESSSNMTSESQSAPQSESSSNMTSESQSVPQSESSSSMTSISTNKTSSQVESKNKQNTKELVKAGEALNVVSIIGALALVMSSLLWMARSKKINN